MNPQINYHVEQFFRKTFSDAYIYRRAFMDSFLSTNYVEYNKDVDWNKQKKKFLQSRLLSWFSHGKNYKLYV